MAHSPEPVAKLFPRTGKTDLGSKTVECETHGPYTSSGAAYVLGRMEREVWTPCPDCEEAKRARELQEQAEASAQRDRARLEEMLNEAAIPARFMGRTLASYRAETQEQIRALSIATEYAENFEKKLRTGDGLILLGAPGTGKSHIAAAILQAIMPRHLGLYTTCAGVIRAVRGTWRQGAEKSEAQVLGMFAEVPLLVIDEVGVQYGTESEQNILFELLDRRYRDMQPTILLANLKLKRMNADEPAGLREVLGERIYDRLTETARIVTFEGESYRARARREGVQ